MNSSRQETILIVDDEASNIRILGEMLKDWDLKVAKDGQTALDIAKSTLPDIILLDIILPDIDGYQVCKELKELAATKEIPIIFITSKDRVEDEVYGLRLGAIDYITKPFNSVIVRTKVENHLEHRRAKKELKKLSQAVEQSTVSILITDPEGKIEYVNPIFTELTGYSFEEVKGKEPSLLKTDYHSDSYYQDLWATISAGKEWKGQFYNQKKNGEYFWEEAVISPVKDERGEIINYVAVKKDITKRKEAEDKLVAKNEELQDTKKMLNKILDLSAEGIRYVAKDYNVVKFNDKYEELNRLYLEKEGLSLAEVIDEEGMLKCYDTLCIQNCVYQECSLVQAMNGVESIQRDVELNLGGVNRYFIVTVAPYRDDNGQLKGILQSYRDITERKKKELEIEVQKVEMERLYDDLQMKLEKATQLHQQFLPSQLPEVKGVSYLSYFQPADKLGGDFYNAIRIGEQLLIYLADVSGHGMDGSMLSIFLKETIDNYLLYYHDQDDDLKLSSLISYVADKYREQDFPADYFICLLVGLLDIEKMEITFANAGFQFPPIYISEEGDLSTLNCGGMPISSAVCEDKFLELYSSDYEEVKISLAKGDTLFLTTDGLLEERVEGEIYEEERLKELLAENYVLPVDLIMTKIKDDFKDFSGSLTGQDDLTFLALKRDLEIIDSFEKTIKSSIEEMYQVKEELMDFIAPYYEMPDLICVGFQEVVTNAIEHGNQMELSKEVTIRVEVTEKYIKAIITDQGEGFDWSEKLEQELDIESDFANEEERGRGIKMANKLYDGVWYNEKGNQAYLFKLRED
ncbi:PAS domain S-box protein [Fuchsiella alkaliacetigena]|uniref:PAS domain S-box protein n=1 Tax=Fuchsiella alkaliacetigena TaxID=957042 RepID=UPI00200A7C51|nr:PAS domain S-box protein [Fuchsiella alkaliacetigena]MCK8824036.1 PAS domain S-box protein [Fuchsiella alkaliacetigena]